MAWLRRWRDCSEAGALRRFDSIQHSHYSDKKEVLLAFWDKLYYFLSMSIKAALLRAVA